MALNVSSHNVIDKRALATGLACAGLLLLSACSLQEDNPLSAGPLPPCTASGSIFQGTLVDTSVIASIYHNQVDIVIEDYLKRGKSMADAPLKCDAEDERSLMPGTGELLLLAKTLPPWKDPKNLAKLSATDMPTVLLEYLRIYECSLLERQYFLPVNINETNNGKFVEKAMSEKEFITNELKTSRPTLERALLVLAGLDRMQPLVAETECLKRTTLDVRNTLGLIAEGMSCLPRAFDNRSNVIEPPAH